MKVEEGYYRALTRYPDFAAGIPGLQQNTDFFNRLLVL